MSTDFASLSHSYQSSCKARGIRLPLGHVHQLLASAFGYRSLAAYQMADEPRIVPEGSHLVLDSSALQERAATLGLDNSVAVVPALGAAFASSLIRGGIHLSEADFFNFLHARLQEVVLNDDAVIRITSDMNSNGMEEVYLPFDFTLDQLPAVGETLEITVNGHVRVRPDPSQWFRGDQVDVEALVTMERWGRNLVGDIRMQIMSVQAGRSERVRDIFNGDRMNTAHAMAYSELLGLDRRLVEQLDNIDVTQNTGSSGEGYYGYILEFDSAGPEHIIEMIRQKHGTTSFEVGPGFFDAGADEFDEPHVG